MPGTATVTSRTGPFCSPVSVRAVSGLAAWCCSILTRSQHPHLRYMYSTFVQHRTLYRLHGFCFVLTAGGHGHHQDHFLARPLGLGARSAMPACYGKRSASYRAFRTLFSLPRSTIISSSRDPSRFHLRTGSRCGDDDRFVAQESHMSHALPLSARYREVELTE